MNEMNTAETSGTDVQPVFAMAGKSAVNTNQHRLKCRTSSVMRARAFIWRRRENNCHVRRVSNPLAAILPTTPPITLVVK